MFPTEPKASRRTLKSQSLKDPEWFGILLCSHRWWKVCLIELITAAAKKNKFQVKLLSEMKSQYKHINNTVPH